MPKIDKKILILINKLTGVKIPIVGDLVEKFIVSIDVALVIVKLEMAMDNTVDEGSFVLFGKTKPTDVVLVDCR